MMRLPKAWIETILDIKIKDHGQDMQHLVRLIAARFSQDRCAQMAATLTFTTLLAVVPALTVLLTVFSAFPAFADVAAAVQKFLAADMVPETGGKLVSFYFDQFSASAARLTVVSLMMLAATAVVLVISIDRALSTIWHVSRPRPVMQRVLIYWLVLTLGPLLVGGSLSLTTWMVAISVGYAAQVSWLGVIVLKITPILLTAPAFTFLFRVVPNRYVPMRHAVIGGVVSAFAFESMNSFFALYLAHLPSYSLVNAAFATIPVFLLWAYLSWICILLGGVIASSLSHWRSMDRQQLDPMAHLYYALCMLRMMNKGLRSGSVQTLPVFCEKLRVGFDVLEQILAKLQRANVVSKLAGQGWGMVREPELVKLKELHRLFVFDPDAIVVRHDDGGIGEWLRREGRKGMGDSDMSLRELFERAGTAFDQPAVAERSELFAASALDK
jgi:membrane protein